MNDTRRKSTDAVTTAKERRAMIRTTILASALALGACADGYGPTYGGGVDYGALAAMGEGMMAASRPQPYQYQPQWLHDPAPRFNYGPGPMGGYSSGYIPPPVPRATDFGVRSLQQRRGW